MCRPSVLKYITSNFPLSPIPPYQDECSAVFSCCHNYIAEGIIVCVERVAVWDSRCLNRRFSNTKLEIGQNGIGNENSKRMERVAYYVRYKRRKENVVNENGKLNIFFYNLFFFVRFSAACNWRRLSLRCAACLTFELSAVLPTLAGLVFHSLSGS